MVEWFKKKPQSMYEFINSESEKNGYVSLKQVLEAPSLEVLLGDLSKASAGKVIQGKFTRVAKRIECITGVLVPNDLMTIVKLRNVIVHEGAEVSIEHSEVVKNIYALREFLEELQIKLNGNHT